VATARTDGQGDVTGDPASYNLVTQASYEAVAAERDARPTAEQLAAVEAERDALPTQAAYDAVVVERDARPTQVAYDAAVATARTDGQGDVTGDPASYNLVTQASYDAIAAERDARPTAEQLAAVEAERDARPTQAAYDAVEAERDARPTQVAHDAAVATAHTEGQGDVTSDPASYNLVTQASYDAVVAERDARPTQASYDTVVAERDAAITERDARFTEDQIHALSADYTIGLNAVGNVQMKINLFESSDLTTFAPLTLTPESLSVVNGKICLEFAPTDDAAFFRFSVE
jgi:hypothetical protein